MAYITKGIGGFYYVKTTDGIVECKARGIFRKRGITPVAGDIVRLETDGGAPVIADILPRKNVFVRPPVANVDQFFIVVSTVQPVPSTLVIWIFCSSLPARPSPYPVRWCWTSWPPLPSTRM